MISLQDKIQKFQKLLYNKQLDDFIPIDDQFIGGGITMESLIKQNAFIVQEIKKVKNVFVNFCKLNQNVYQKLIQHQLALHNQNNKLITLSSNVQRKMNDSIKQIKQMYEEMKYQALKTKDLVGQAVRPIQQAIKQKVDQSSFSRQMKKILQQLDEGDGATQNVEGGSGEPGQLQDMLIRKKKGKNVLYEDYLHDKQKNNKLFLQLCQKIQNMQYKNRQNDAIIYKNTSNLNKIILTVDNHENQIFKINRQLKEIRSNLQLTQQRLQTQITSKTNDSVWQKKFNLFQSNNVTPKIQSLSKLVNRNQKQMNKNFAQLQPKFQKVHNTLQQLKKQNQSHQVKILKNELKIKQQIKQREHEVNDLNQKLKKLEKIKKIKIQKVYQTIEAEIMTRKKQIQSLNNTIKDLSKELQGIITKNVKKNIDYKINQIQQNVKKLSINSHNTKQEVHQITGQMNNIKEILCKKANFTDILIQFEKKADKQDFKQLKDKIDTAPSYLKSTIIQSPQKTRRTISSNSRRKTSLSKNLIVPINANNFDKESLQSDFQGTSRLYIMGLQNDLGFQNDKRRMSFTQSALRRKKMKSSTAGVTGIFGN